jgi:hypothetical protein
MMGALLALVPLKDGVYGSIIVALLAGFGWYTVHERNEGAAKIVAADKRTVLVAEAKDKAIVVAAQDASNQIGVVYEKAVSIPAIADVGLVCESPHSNPVPGTADYKPENPGAPAQPSSGVFDPSGGVLTLLRDDDAQINALIDQVDALTDTMTKLHAATAP